MTIFGDKFTDSNEILFLVDIDGFQVSDCPQTKYLTKELAVFTILTLSVGLFRFRLHRSINSLKPGNLKSANYCKHHVHGLQFRDYRHDLNQKSVKYLISRLVAEANNRSMYIAYKGGDIERDLLTDAHADRIINIEVYRPTCPKFEVLLNQPESVSYTHLTLPTIYSV